MPSSGRSANGRSTIERRSGDADCTASNPGRGRIRSGMIPIVVIAHLRRALHSDWHSEVLARSPALQLPD